MLNINCTMKCAYQNDGKCTKENIESAGHSNGLCAYFMQPDKIKKAKKE